jgi:hypothetical protein
MKDHQKKQRKQWKDFSAAQKTRIIMTAIYNLTMMTVMLVDLRRRPASQIKGDKRLWVLAAFVQPFGPIAYFAFGRKRKQLLEA